MARRNASFVTVTTIVPGRARASLAQLPRDPGAPDVWAAREPHWQCRQVHGAGDRITVWGRTKRSRGAFPGLGYRCRHPRRGCSSAVRPLLARAKNGPSRRGARAFPSSRVSSRPTAVAFGSKALQAAGAPFCSRSRKCVQSRALTSRKDMRAVDIGPGTMIGERLPPNRHVGSIRRGLVRWERTTSSATPRRVDARDVALHSILAPR